MKLSIQNKNLIQRFFANKPVKRAYVFGSVARNEATSDSDLDILVELDHSFPIGMKFFSYQIELEELLKTRVELVSDEGISQYIKPFVDQDKILIYERQSAR
ncbi:MAG: nucleotidyltransferase domain-containing protein [Cyclobacteriaceae bacterium]|nr:nucleotidyltransferase domain-containing protein [Cyclobacteriaceae bacterium]